MQASVYDSLGAVSTSMTTGIHVAAASVSSTKTALTSLLSSLSTTSLSETSLASGISLTYVAAVLTTNTSVSTTSASSLRSQALQSVAKIVQQQGSFSLSVAETLAGAMALLTKAPTSGERRAKG